MPAKPKKPKYCIECIYAIEGNRPYTDTTQTAYCTWVRDPVTKLPAPCEYVRTRTDAGACGPRGRYFKAK